MSRAADEITLTCLDLRRRGYTPAQIAPVVGKTVQYVSTALNRVADADMAHDPEAAAAYPWRRASGAPGRAA